MLVYFLALLVGFGSFALYMAAFFLPEVHRKNDFIWSGIGLFYALALWVYAGRIMGGVLLGQLAGVALLGWFSWQTLTLRRQLADPDHQTPLPTVEELRSGLDGLSTAEGRSQLLDQASRTFTQVKTGMQGAIATQVPAKGPSRVTVEEPYVPPALEEFGTAGREATERFAKASIAEIQKASAKAYRKASETVEAALEEAEAAIDDLSPGTVPPETVPPKTVPPETVPPETVSAPTVGRGATGRTSTTVGSSAPLRSATSRSATNRMNSTPKSRTVAPNLPEKSANPVQALTETAQGLFKGLTKKKEQKPVYVRKQYREAAIEISPNRAANSPLEATVEEIVEELLEDISAQESAPHPRDIEGNS